MEDELTLISVFTEICDRILGKRPRFANGVHCELSPELQKRFLKLEEDVERLHSNVAEVREQSHEILQHMETMISMLRPLPQFLVHNPAQPISF